jgi:hypothetical protein
MLFNQFLKGHKAFVEEQRKVQGSTRRSSPNNLSASGWSWGCVSAIDSSGRTIWIADAHRRDGERFIRRADEKLTRIGDSG